MQMSSVSLPSGTRSFKSSCHLECLKTRHTCYKHAGDGHCTQSTWQDMHHSRQTATAEEAWAADWAVRQRAWASPVWVPGRSASLESHGLWAFG